MIRRAVRRDREEATVSLIGGGILLVLLLIFIFQNTADTVFKFLFWSFTFPLWLGLLITAVVAFVIGQFALMWRRHKRRQARRAHSR